MNATFLAAGLLTVAACGLALVALIGVPWTVAGVSPCDAGCPAEGSASQAVPSYQRVVRPTPIMRPCMIEFGARNDALSALVVT